MNTAAQKNILLFLLPLLSKSDEKPMVYPDNSKNIKTVLTLKKSPSFSSITLISDILDSTNKGLLSLSEKTPKQSITKTKNTTTVKKYMRR